MLSLRTQRRSCSPGSRTSVRSTSFAPAGFFTSRIDRSRAARRTVSARPKAGATASRPAIDVVERGAERERQGRRAERVVDVVEPGQGQGDRGVAGRRAQREARAADAVEHDVGGGDLRARGGRRRRCRSGSGPGGRGRPRRSGRARRSAGSAWRRRRAAWRPWPCVVLDPEVQRVAVATEVGDRRVVGVEDEARGGRRGDAPPSGRRSSRARRSGRAGRGRGWPAAARAGGARRRPGRARTRRPRRGRCRRPDRRRGGRPPAASRRRRRPCWRRRGCGRGGRRRARGSRRPSRRSSSCRSWPR